MFSPFYFTINEKEFDEIFTYRKDVLTLIYNANDNNLDILFFVFAHETAIYYYMQTESENKFASNIRKILPDDYKERIYIAEEKTGDFRDLKKVTDEINKNIIFFAMIPPHLFLEYNSEILIRDYYKNDDEWLEYNWPLAYNWKLIKEKIQQLADIFNAALEVEV